ncbi:heme iron utilization protein [Desulfarculales bacterium]
MLDKMKELITSQDVCALATVSPEGQPHCSLMFYVTDDHGRHIYLLTRGGTKKYRNVSANPSVSILIDSREQRVSTEPALALTITGICETLPEGGLHDTVLNKLLTRHPHLQGVSVDPQVKVLAVRSVTMQLLQGPMSVCYAQMD